MVIIIDNTQLYKYYCDYQKNKDNNIFNIILESRLKKNGGFIYVYPSVNSICQTLINTFSRVQTSDENSHMLSKSYEGRYDVEDIPCLLGEEIWKIFIDEKIRHKIRDGDQLAQLIIYNSVVRINKENSHLNLIEFNTPIEEIPDSNKWEELIIRENSSVKKKRKRSFRKPFDDIFSFLQNNDIRNLVKDNATEILFLIESISNDSDYELFIRINDEYYKLNNYEAIAETLSQKYNKDIKGANICRDLKILAEKILEQQFLDLSYKVEDNKPWQFDKCSIKELKEKRYIKANSITDDYTIIDKYIDNEWQIKKNDSVMWLRTWKNREQKEPHITEFKISNLLVFDCKSHYYLCLIDEKKAYKLKKENKILKRSKIADFTDKHFYYYIEKN